MPDLPLGTVTFLFTDIEGSTRLLSEYPQAYPGALARHDALLRAAIEAHGGTVFETVGDAFYAAFGRASDAVTAATTAQQALESTDWQEIGSLRARMALHTGEVEVRGDHYFGPALYRCARLMASGHGGQILLSSVTAEIVRDSLPPETSLRPLGTHRLKDLPHPETVFQLLHPALQADFPPLRTQTDPPNNLPTPLTSFVGREQELAEVTRLLHSTRMLTLTGVGGAGKTRLALQVATDALTTLPDGAWWVELAALPEPALVVQAAASAVGVREAPGRNLLSLLQEELQSKQLLLLLDNCEHLLSTCAELADALLRTCPRLRILATSREALGVPGETTWQVPSLTLPAHEQALGPERLAQYDAVRLFIDRATAALPSFSISNANAPALAQICWRLDGIPLAIELAASRVRALSLEQIARRLDDRFHLLTGGSRTALPRQQTLRAAVDWSYELLSEPERRMWRCLSVFAGGCSLEAAEAVCGDEEGNDVLDLLARLVDKSLVQTEEQPTGLRYRLLETIREYGIEKLQAAGDEARVRRLHRDWYLNRSIDEEPELWGPRQAEWFDRLDTDLLNLRAALEWSKIEQGGAIAGLRLATALLRYWEVRGRLSEGREWLTSLLSQVPAEERKVAWARAAGAAGYLAMWQGDYAATRSFIDDAVRVAREHGDQPTIAASLTTEGMIAQFRGDHASARQKYEESLALWRPIGHRPGISSALFLLGGVSVALGDYARVHELHAEALALQREQGDIWGLAFSLFNLGRLAWLQGDYQRAIALHQECLSLHRTLGDKRAIAMCFERLGWIAVAQQHSVRAAYLLGAAEALGAAIGFSISPSAQVSHNQAVAAVKAALGDAAFRAAWSEGHAMPLDKAFDYALERATAVA